MSIFFQNVNLQNYNFSGPCHLTTLTPINLLLSLISLTIIFPVFRSEPLTFRTIAPSLDSHESFYPFISRFLYSLSSLYLYILTFPIIAPSLILIFPTIAQPLDLYIPYHRPIAILLTFPIISPSLNSNLL